MALPDREKVIAALEKACRDSVELPPFVGRIEITKEAIEDGILPLLREQEPVEPTVDTRDGWYRCGKCGYSLATGERVRSFGAHKWPVYCEKCGRKVDWNA